MLNFFYYLVGVLLSLRFSWAFNGTAVCQYDAKRHLIVVALLNLHDEMTGCSKVTLRGLQQTALLEKIVSDINRKDSISEGISMVLHMVNTCSNQEDGVAAALKSLVISQQTCINSPLLLGFIGPENYKQFQEVNKITSEFKKFHVIPFAPGIRRSKEENSILYIGSGRPQIRSKIILAVLNQLEWRSIYAIVGESVALNGVLDSLLNELERVCITGVSKIPKDASTTKTFFETALAEFRESGADGILISVENPSQIRPILNEMNERFVDGKQNIPFVFYVNRVGLKSWELPLNYRILLLQETSELGSGSDFKKLYNKTLWNTYAEDNGLDYRKDAFEDLLDSSILALEYGVNLLWNAAKYARKIKCNLGNSITSNDGICDNLLGVSAAEWKTFMHKASYYDATTLRKISFEMNVPVTVQVYYHEISFRSPQLIGRITEMGIMDLKISLPTVIQTAAKTNPKRCMTSSTKATEIPITTTINHETNWLAIVSKKMKNLIQLDGIVSPQINEKINTTLSWSLGIILFIFGLILITKCVYTIFRVETEDEQTENRRRKHGRNTRIMSD